MQNIKYGAVLLLARPHGARFQVVGLLILQVGVTTSAPAWGAILDNAEHIDQSKTLLLARPHGARPQDDDATNARQKLLLARFAAIYAS